VQVPGTFPVEVSMSKQAVQARIEQIESRMNWMQDNYFGCDWCCGGGDEEMRALSKELRGLRRRSAILSRKGSVVRVGRL
jgi:hypothetical protein